MDDTAGSPALRLARLLDGFVTTQLVYVAAKLGIPAVLEDGPRAGTEIAAAVGADAGALVRVLRGLVVDGVLAEDGDGRFALTDVGAALVPMHGAAIARGEVYYESAAGLLEAVRGGGTAFERVHGAPFFDHLGRHPDQEAAFQGSMAGRAEQEARDVVAAYDVTGLGTVVDVGGGRGVLLAEILRADPSARGVLMDRDAAIPAARARLTADGLADRVECVAGDFFVRVPAGGDTYVLSRVLHDWDDTDARRILDTCRAAMAPAARLLVIDAVLPVRALDAPGAIRMDLHMLMLFGSRERTEAELGALLGAAGLTVARVVPTSSPTGLAVTEARPA